MEIEPIVQKLVSRLQELYTNKTQPQPVITEESSVWRTLRGLLPTPSLEEIVYIVETVNHPGSRHCQELVREAIEMTGSITDMRVLVILERALPDKWGEERVKLLERATEIAKDKEELVQYLRDTKYLD